MDILIIGGTKFLGRALTAEIFARGHNLTLFHRGKTNPEYMPEIPRILGDRELDLDKLEGRSWDVVIDTCGYVPRIVELSARALKDKADNYVFISSISAYESSTEVGMDETAVLDTMEDETTEEITGETYGPLKVLCEQVVEEEFGEQASIIRPGLIVGPHDPTNRFTYWLHRVRRGGEVLAPGERDSPIQFIDVRDLARFCIDLAEQQVGGAFNVVGPSEPLPLDQLLEQIQTIVDSDADLRWIPSDWLLEHEVGPWMEIPLWLPSPEGKALMQVNIDKALDHGLQFSSLERTVIDTLDWYDTIDGDNRKWQAGLDSAREQELLEEYRSEQ